MKATIAQASRRTSIVCSASDKKQVKFEKPRKLFNDFHKSRVETFKLNANDLVKVSQSEINAITSFLKELDTFHKEQAAELKKRVDDVRSKAEKKDVKSEESEVTGDVIVDVDVTVSAEADDENIFLKK